MLIYNNMSHIIASEVPALKLSDQGSSNVQTSLVPYIQGHIAQTPRNEDIHLHDTIRGENYRHY